jgi:Zn-finger nucleic acid-binding protein
MATEKKICPLCGWTVDGGSLDGCECVPEESPDPQDYQDADRERARFLDEQQPRRGGQ